MGDRRMPPLDKVVAWLAGFWIATRTALASGGEAAGALQHRVDTTALRSGDLLLATLYNDHRVVYALVTTLGMAVCGFAIAITTDVVLGHLGLRASRAAERRE